MNLRATLLLVGTLAAVSPAFAGDYNTGYFGNVAIEGYDTVAYFTDNKGIKGDAAITAEYGGAVWHFASAEHRDMFVADPAAYAPQFGGLCAEGVAYGEISANLSPEVFEIVDGKLYLNYATYWVDLEANIPIAQSKWEGVHALLAGDN
jgi:YHS domain-containing protein